MWTFAWRNLATRPLRTILALVGLSIPILGVMGLFSVSNGLRNLVGNTLDQIKGVMVLRENVPTPVFSTPMPGSLAADLRKIPGVRSAASEVWGLPPNVGEVVLIPKNPLELLRNGKEKIVQSLFDATVIQGQDIEEHRDLKSAVYPRALKEGRYLQKGDEGKSVCVISRKIAKEHRDPKTKAPKSVGDTLKVGDEVFTIIGIYETGSMLLDPIMVMDIDSARRVLGFPKDKISSVYVEATDPSKIDEVASRIEETIKSPRVDARSMAEFAANFNVLMGQLDKFLLMMVSLALVVGVVGIINTMLMSTTERFAEFGVLRTNGWSRTNVLTLVTAESAYLGLLAGVIGCVLAFALIAVANPFLEGGIQLGITPGMIGIGLGLSVGMGTLGGLYPAWKASRLVPMDAIRLGAR